MHSFSECEEANVDIESFVVCIGGKMAQDVRWKYNVVSFYSSLLGFLGVPSLHVLVSAFLGMITENRGGRGGQEEDAWSYESIELCCSQGTNNCCINSNASSVNPTIKLLYICK